MTIETRIVISLNHFPIAVMKEGTTVEEAALHCTLLGLKHKETSHTGRNYSYSTVPVEEPRK